MSSKWSSRVEEVKRIVLMLIPHASVSFQACIYISFPSFHLLLLLSRFASLNLTIFDALVKVKLGKHLHRHC